MKDKLRYEVPDDSGPQHEPAFYNKVMHFANVLRTKRMAGEISEAECLGAEASLQHYGVQYGVQAPTYDRGAENRGGYQFKPEPVYAVPEPVYAVSGGNTPAAKNCYYCMKPGHFIAQCPRKIGGLPAVNVVGGAGGVPPSNPADPSGKGYYPEESVNAVPPTDAPDLGYPEAYLGDYDATVNALYRGGYRGQRGSFRGRVGRGVYRPAIPNSGYPNRGPGFHGPRVPGPTGYAGGPRTPHKKFQRQPETQYIPMRQRVAYLQQDQDGNEYWQEKLPDNTPAAAYVADGAEAPPEEGVHALPSAEATEAEYLHPQPFLGL